MFSENDDEYDYLLHNTKVDGGEGILQFVWQQLSFTKIKTGEHIADHKVYPLEAFTIRKDNPFFVFIV